MSSPTIAYVRKFIQDTPFQNQKYDDYIFHDVDIQLAIEAAQDEAASLPPITIGHQPIGKFVMVLGTVAQLFFQRYLNKTLNYAPGIQENGIAVPVGEEAGVLKGVYDELHNQFVMMVKQAKQAITITGSMTQIPSPYNGYRRGRGGGNNQGS